MAVGRSSWQERRGFHSEDQRLRAHGFAIYSRPKDAPPVWEKGGSLFSEKEATAICDRREQETA